MHWAGKDGYEFMMTNVAVIMLNIVFFSMNEKIRKELFIINLTNSKTKK